MFHLNISNQTFTDDSPADQNIAFVDTFLALQLTGAVLFALIVLSACIFRSAKRHPIFFSFCISWIVFGLAYSLLLFAGQQYKRPDRILCTIQAALIYAVPFLELGASLGLTIHLLLNVLAALSPSAMKKKSYPTFINVLVTLPWVIWTGIFVGVLAVSEMRICNVQQVSMSPNHTYCVIQDSAIPKITAIGVTVGCTGILAVEFTIGALLYRNRAIVNIFSQSLGMAIRIFVFTILGFGAIRYVGWHRSGP
ncbi:hypothetical protein BDZ97DRAFT_1670064 [Flammula alnicola]|nr:hypothetical protein BDZ97DRAFT_1670064 [Flammula alnicola]